VTGFVEGIERRLVELREQETGTRRAGVRTNVLDLVIYTDANDTAGELAELVATLPYSRPSRAIVALAEDRGDHLHYEARVFCFQSERDSEPMCSELVELTAGEGGAALPSLISSLLLPDLPVFLLWKARPDFGGHMIERLWPLADRFIVDSTSHRGTLAGLPQLFERRPPKTVTDLSWTKITAWREGVARAFDTAENARMLHELSRVEISHVAPSHAQARLLAAWLMSRLDRDFDVELTAEQRSDMRSGSLTSVRLECGGEQVLVLREDEGIGIVRAPRIAEHHVPLRVPALRELVADELQIFERDVVFEETVPWLPATLE
jgi:glucose-6-phosphate dehydrogenase assembly protein OpcA